jgi:hypothetical protein
MGENICGVFVDGGGGGGAENLCIGAAAGDADRFREAAPGKGVSDCAGQGQNDYACARRIGKESCPIAPAPNREREKRQRAANSKSEVLNRVIQIRSTRSVIGNSQVDGGSS